MFVCHNESVEVKMPSGEAVFSSKYKDPRGTTKVAGLGGKPFTH